MADLKNADKQYLAKILFTTQQLDQKAVAARVGVSENTMSKWVNDFNWKALRNRLATGKQQLLNDFYEELEELQNKIREREKGERYSNTKEADIKVKLTAAIRTLETDLGIADLSDAGMKFIKHLQTIVPHDEVMHIADLWNGFMHASVKKA